MILAALVALSMGGTCRQETAQSVFSSFLTQIAVTTGEAVAESLIDRPSP
jgi:hypothetical protein